MRSVIVSIVISIAVIWGGMAYTDRIEKISDTMLSYNDSIEENIENGNYSAALEAIDGLREFTDSSRAAMEATGDHEEINKIEMTLAELEAYTKKEMSADAAAKCSVLCFLIKHLPKNFELKIENIL